MTFIPLYLYDLHSYSFFECDGSWVKVTFVISVYDISMKLCPIVAYSLFHNYKNFFALRIETISIVIMC